MRFALLLLLAAACGAQEPAVDGVSLGMTRAEVERGRQLKWSTKDELEFVGGTKVEFDLRGRACLIQGKSIRLRQSWFEPGREGRPDRLQVRAVLGAPHKDLTWWEAWRLADGTRLRVGRDSQLVPEENQVRVVLHDTVRDYELERWTPDSSPLSPQLVTLDGLAPGATRAQVDALQAARGLAPDGSGPEVCYSASWGGGPKVWFDPAGVCRQIEAPNLRLDDHEFHCGSSRAKLECFLGRPDSVEDREADIKVLRYERWHLRAYFAGGRCYALRLGEE